MDVVWVSESMTDVRLLIMVYLRWQPKHTSGWIEAPGYSRTCLFSFGRPPRLKGIISLFILETSVCSHKLLWALA